MTYPDTILTKPVRRTFMLFLFAVFFVVSPLILFYTAGYRYDFYSHKVRQTGVLNIDAKPSNMQVYLNDVLIKKSLPIYLPNRAPGAYTIKLSAPDYQDWNKDVTIESKRTTYIKDVTLFKQSHPTQILVDFDKNIIDMSGSYDGNYFTLLTENNDIFELYIYDINKQSITSLSRVRTDNQPKVNWSPFANHLTVQTAQNNRYSLQIFDANNQNNSQTYTHTTPLQYQWSNNAYIPSVYLKNNEKIYLLTINDEQTVTIVSSTVSTWYIENQNNIWTYQNKTLTNEEKIFNLENEYINIININNNRIIYQTNNETKVVKIDNDKIVETYTLPTQQIIYNGQTNEWITWSWWELWTIYNDGNVELLDRTGEKMININPLDKYGVLLLSNENKMTGFNPGYYVSHELLNNAEIKDITVNYKLRKIYFWGTADGKTGVFELDY